MRLLSTVQSAEYGWACQVYGFDAYCNVNQ
jgi:hypothetical protein